MHTSSRGHANDAQQQSCLSGITIGRSVGLVNGTPAGTAAHGPAARKVDQAVEERGACDSVHRRGHIRQVDPGITNRIKHVVVREDPVGGERISLAPEDVNVAVCDDGVHSPAWLEHWGCSRPAPCGDIIHFHLVKRWCLESGAGATTHDIDPAPYAHHAKVVALRGEDGKKFPAIGGGIIDGKVIPARRPAACDIDPAVHDRCATAGTGRRHGCAGTPTPTIGIEGVDGVHEGTVATGFGLPTDNVQDTVHRYGHSVVKGHG